MAAILQMSIAFIPKAEVRVHEQAAQLSRQWQNFSMAHKLRHEPVCEQD